MKALFVLPMIALMLAAIGSLLALTATGAEARSPVPRDNIRDHRTQPTIRDHRTPKAQVSVPWRPTAWQPAKK